MAPPTAAASRAADSRASLHCREDTRGGGGGGGGGRGEKKRKQILTAGVQTQVLWFDVSVRDAHTMAVFQPLYELSKVMARPGLAQAVVLLDVDMIEQLAATAKVHDQKHALAIAGKLNSSVADHVSMVDLRGCGAVCCVVLC